MIETLAKCTCCGLVLCYIGQYVKQVDAGAFDRGVKEYLMEQLHLSGIRALEGLSFDRPLYIAFNDAAVRDAFDT